MSVEQIHTFLVHAKADDGTSRLLGTSVPLTGRLFHLLNDVYGKADRECDIEISFNARSDGTPQNPCRDAIVAYVASPSLERARAIAQRLEAVTTNRSGLGLLFVVVGTEDGERKVVLSRFPADSAVMADESPGQLQVEFLERVFMKSAYSYKAAVYQGASTTSQFWHGRAVDKQIAKPAVRASDYWVRGFLDSDFLTTSAAGTRRLAVAMREAVRSTSDLTVKRELAAAATLAQRLGSETMSIAAFQKRFSLSPPTIDAMNKVVKHPAVINEQFLFDSHEFSNQVPYRSVELDSGAILTAGATEFDRVFRQEPVGRGDRVRITTEGRVVGEKLRKTVL